MRAAAIAICLIGFAASDPAAACSVVRPSGYDGSAEQRRQVRDAIERASLIVDGEVIRAQTHAGTGRALVRVHRILKGQAGETIHVGDNGGDSCAIMLDRPGQRSRMILSGGPGAYVLYRDQSEARIEDHFLRSDRRRIWPYFDGEPLTR